MCTAATYQTKDFYFGRTLDYEFSYGDADFCWIFAIWENAMRIMG